MLPVLAGLALCGAAAAADPAPKDGGVLVFGGAGNLGAEIVKELVRRGDAVTVFVKPDTDRKRLAGQPVAFVEGDARAEPDVRRAFATAKFRVAINALARRNGEENFWDRTQMAITAAAKATGVREVVFLSSVGVGDSATAYSPEAYARAKSGLIARGRAEDDLKASGLDYVIIRTGAVLGVGTPATGKARLTEDRTVLGPVTRPDLAALTVSCIGSAACRNRTFHATDDTLAIPQERGR
jgi:uncharacterized protein YbjT (DUF2867 family)